MEALRYLRARIKSSLAARRERSKDKDHPICEGIRIPSEVLQTGTVRHLRRMATAKTTFVNSLSGQIRTDPPCATLEDSRQKTRRLQYSIHAGSDRDWVGYSAPLAGDKQTANSVASAHCFPNEGGLFTLLRIARIIFESQMAHDPASCANDDSYACLRGSATNRQTRRRFNLRRFSFRCAVVCRAKRNSQRNRLCQASQPFT